MCVRTNSALLAHCAAACWPYAASTSQSTKRRVCGFVASLRASPTTEDAALVSRCARSEARTTRNTASHASNCVSVSSSSTASGAHSNSSIPRSHESGRVHSPPVVHPPCPCWMRVWACRGYAAKRFETRSSRGSARIVSTNPCGAPTIAMRRSSSFSLVCKARAAVCTRCVHGDVGWKRGPSCSSAYATRSRLGGAAATVDAHRSHLMQPHARIPARRGRPALAPRKTGATGIVSATGPRGSLGPRRRRASLSRDASSVGRDDGAGLRRARFFTID